MHHFDFFKHRGHGHDRHYHKRDRKHGGKFCEKFGKRKHFFKNMLCFLAESDLATMNPQDPDIEEKIRLFVKEFFDKRVMERHAGMDNPKENGAGEEDYNPQAAANSMCMWKGRGRRFGWRGCQYCQTAGRNISEEKTQNATDTEGKKSEEDTEETPYCKHLDHHHRGYGRRHHSYGHGEWLGRFSGDESRGRRDHHDHRHHHHHERHGYNHHGRMGWKNNGCDCFHVGATATANKNADSGSQEPNQEVGASDMHVDPAPAPEIENLENEERSQQEVLEVADTLRKSSLE